MRTAARLASRLGGVWHAVWHVRNANVTPRLPEKQRQAIFKRAALAQELGRNTTLRSPKKAVVRYTRAQHLIAGRPASRRWWRRDIRRPSCERAPDADRVIVALEEPPAARWRKRLITDALKMAWAGPGRLSGRRGACAITTLIAMQWLVTLTPPIW